eukprot:CAMPEP_0181485294 /NCGR_PEP_ID=MMETSP1110-20121109/46489_1 /TAXON_ID=174948 /ORGANISM="Symbiodinium sp., Strain CCMP421" /LENGTH=33 /DNA_ID= /DNA_START= /DNA_END= /DNA_ORIENTATION=
MAGSNELSNWLARNQQLSNSSKGTTTAASTSPR